MRLALVCVFLTGVFTLLGARTASQVIAYVGMTETVRYTPNLYLMDSGRGIAERITDMPIYHCCLHWSPDGTQIAFDGNQNRTQVVNVYGGGSRTLTPDRWAGYALGWSADGQRLILMTLSTTQGSFYRVDADGDQFTQLSEKALDKIVVPVLSADGRYAFYAQQQANTVDWLLYELNLEDGTSRVFVDENWIGMEGLALSPDGQRAGYIMRQGTEVVLMNRDGSNLRRLKPEGDALSMVWSPDSQQILFLAQTRGLFDVYITDANGENPHNLGLKGQFIGIDNLAWSPDATQIVFAGIVRRQNTYPDVYLMDADGTDLRQLTVNPTDDKFPAWRPALKP